MFWRAANMKVIQIAIQVTCLPPKSSDTRNRFGINTGHKKWPCEHKHTLLPLSGCTYDPLVGWSKIVGHLRVFGGFTTLLRDPRVIQPWWERGILPRGIDLPQRDFIFRTIHQGAVCIYTTCSHQRNNELFGNKIFLNLKFQNFPLWNNGNICFSPA
jgi:hypothetical protein